MVIIIVVTVWLWSGMGAAVDNSYIGGCTYVCLGLGWDQEICPPIYLFMQIDSRWTNVFYLFIFVFLTFPPPAMPQRWWRQQVGSPWWRLILTWWPKLTAPWLPPSALFSDPHASASNNPNSLTAGHVHSCIHTHMHTHKKNTQDPPWNTQGQLFPLLLPTTLPTSCPRSPPSAPSKPAVFSLLKLEGRRRRRRRWKSGAGGLVKWMFVVYKETTTTPFLFSPGIVRSDIVLFSVCEVESFDILLVPTLESVWKEELDTTTPKRANCLEIWRFKGEVFDCLFYHKASVFSIWSRAVGEAPKLMDTWACEGLKKKK